MLIINRWENIGGRHCQIGHPKKEDANKDEV